MSTILHGFFLILIGFVIWGDRLRPKNDVLEMLVIEAPKLSTQTVDITAPKEIPKVDETKRAVFGASRKSLTSDTGVEVKAGNTLAKTPDEEKLRDDDVDQLPIPVEEYAVSEMPQLESEFRVPYPPEARKANIQGAVIMDLLIDAKGGVREVRFVQGPGFGLNEAALEAASKFRFRPAKIGSQSVAVRIRYSYRFVLER